MTLIPVVPPFMQGYISNVALTPAAEQATQSQRDSGYSLVNSCPPFYYCDRKAIALLFRVPRKGSPNEKMRGES
ncbi:hypothetical protein [Alkalimarinus coralli]|uniref:hypothetical protein n=1 Tax=Alkalimarinus coralli TaxID=2935863 RepID=UPI00202B82D7|nr:hypothetical protein [Alkalimarinus coralli]